nr:hypothetical protein GCM10020092_064340 [Actinoplanes digitatis]
MAPRLFIASLWLRRASASMVLGLELRVAGDLERLVLCVGEQRLRLLAGVAHVVVGGALRHHQDPGVAVLPVG